MVDVLGKGQAYQSGGTSESGAFGLGISGSTSVNNINGSAEAYIENSEINADGDISIKAAEKSDIVTGSGGLSANLQSGENSSVLAIAGAASINMINNKASAYIGNSKINNKGKVTVDAQSDSSILAIAAGLAGSSARKGINIAGSATVNITENEIIAYIDNSTVSGEGDLSVSAEDKSDIFSIAGAAALGNNSTAVGSGVGINLINNKVLSYLNATNTDIKNNNLSVIAANKTNIQTYGVTAGIVSGSIAGAISVIVNNIGNTTQAYINGKNDQPAQISAGDITVKASDKSDIEAVAGSVAGSNKVGVGASVGVNEIGNSVSAYIKNVELLSEGNIIAESESDSRINLAVAAAGLGGKVGVVGGVSINSVSNKVNSFIENSKIGTEGSVKVAAKNKDNITMMSGALAYGGIAGVSGNLGLNTVKNEAKAEIRQSDINAFGNKADETNILSGIEVSADMDENITVYNASAAGGGTVAVSGGYTATNVENNSSAIIKDSAVNMKIYGNTGEEDIDNSSEAQSVYVTAKNKTDVSTYSAAAAGAGTVAVGAAADSVNISNTIRAAILNSEVKAEYDVEVKTDNCEEYDAVIVAGAGSGGVSAAGSVALVNINSKNNADISASSIQAENDVSVSAKDNVKLGDDGEGVTVGAAAGGIYAGIGGGLFSASVSNKTSAGITDSQIEAIRNFNLNAISLQKIKSIVPSLGGGVVGVGLSAALTVINTVTKAVADGNTVINAGEDISIAAKNDTEVKAAVMAASGGIVGVGASLSIMNINNDVAAGIGNAIKANAGHDVNIQAENKRNIKDSVLSLAGGFVGANGSVSVVKIGDNIGNNNDAAYENTSGYRDGLDTMMSRSSEYNEENAGSGGLTSKYITDIKKLDQDTNAVFGATVIQDGTSAFIGNDAQITAGNDINLKADDGIEFESTVGGASGGFVGIGASVNIADIKTSANAYVGNNAVLKAKDINVISNNLAKNIKMLTFIGTGGFVSVSAAVSMLNLRNDSSARLQNGVAVFAYDKVNVLADSKTNISNDLARIAGAVVGVGATYASTNKEGVTEASLGDNVKVGTLGSDTQELLMADEVKVKATSETVIDNTSLSGTAGALNIRADIFETKVSESIKSFTGSNSLILASKELILATDGNIKINSAFTGVSLALASLGVAMGKAEINFSNDVIIGENNTLAAENISVSAMQKASADVEAKIGSIGAVDISGNKASTLIKGNVSTVVAQGNKIYGDNIAISANANTEQKASTYMRQAGGIVIGLGYAESQANVNVKNLVEGGSIIEADGALNIKGNMKNIMYSETESGKAGIISAGGASTKTTNNSSNNVIIGSEDSEDTTYLYAENLDISANTTIEQDAKTVASNLSLANGAGLKNDNKSVSTVDVMVNGKTDIFANNINIEALNNYKKDKYSVHSKSDALSGLDLFKSESITDITNNTKINFAGNTDIRTYKNSKGHSSFVIDAANDIYAHERADYKSFSLLNGSEITSKIKNNSLSDISFNGKIRSAGDFHANARTYQVLHDIINADINSAGILFKGDATSESTVKNLININNGADIFSAGNLYLNLSQDNYGSLSRYDTAANITAYLTAFIPLDNSKIKSKLNVTDKVTIAEGGSVKAAETIEIGARGRLISGEGYLFVAQQLPILDIGIGKVKNSTDRVFNSSAEIDGEVLAGYNNKILVNIDGSYEHNDAHGKEEALQALKDAITITNEYDTGNLDYYFTPDRALANNLYLELAEIERQLNDYEGNSLNDLEVFLNSEKSRIERQLVNLGLPLVNDGSTEISVPSVIFGNIYTGIGDIKINTDNLYGSGHISASDAAEVVINNNSNLFMEFGDIVISNSSDASGKIFINGVNINGENKEVRLKNIKKLNKNSNFEVIFDAVDFGSGDTDSAIVINSNQGAITNPNAIRPSIDFFGNVENRKGLVSVNSDWGDINIYGNMHAADLQISAARGNIVQSYWNKDIIFHVENPETAWSQIVKANEDKHAKTASEKDFGTEEYTGSVNDRTTSSIIGNSIFISGKYLDINGLIQAGYADYVLDIKNNNLQLLTGLKGNERISTIADALAYYNARPGASKLFKLADIHGNVEAYYNIETGQIMVDDINTKGGGSIELYGHIMNTSSNSGELKALNGYSKVNVSNLSDFGINLKNIDVSEKVDGQIKITDLAKNIGSLNAPKYLETIYTFNGNNIVMTDNRTVGSDGKGNNSAVLNGGRETSYSPFENQRYNWTKGNNTNEYRLYEKVEKKESWFGWNFGNIFDSLNKKDIKSITITPYNPLENSEYLVMGQSGEPRYKFEYRNSEMLDKYKYTKDPEKVKKSTNGLGKTTTKVTVRAHEERNFKNFYTHSIQADNPIKIGFIGHNDAQSINVNSNSDVMLKGSLDAGQGNLAITSQKSIDTLGIGQLAAKNITLDAKTGIGNTSDITLRLKGGQLDAVNKISGDINLRAKNSAGASDTKVGKILNYGDGKIKLISDNSIVRANAVAEGIKGKSVELESKLGGINNGSTPYFIFVEADMLKAIAQGDIALDLQSSSGMGIDKIESKHGDIRINVLSGDIYEKRMAAHSNVKSAELMPLWKELGLLSEDGGGWTSEQLMYAWAAKNADKNTLGEEVISGENVSIFSTGKIGSKIDGFSFNVSEYDSLTDIQKNVLMSANPSDITTSSENGNTIITLAKNQSMNLTAKGTLALSGTEIYINSNEDITTNDIRATKLELSSAKNIHVFGNSIHLYGNGYATIKAAGDITNLKMDARGHWHGGNGNAPVSISAGGSIIDIYVYGHNDISVKAGSNIENFIFESQKSINNLVNVEGDTHKLNIDGGGDVIVNAAKDINGGVISGKGDVEVKAGRDILNTGIYLKSGEKRLLVEAERAITGGGIDSIGEALIKANEDITGLSVAVHGNGHARIIGLKDIKDSLIVSYDAASLYMESGGNISNLSANYIYRPPSSHYAGGIGLLEIRVGENITDSRIHGRGDILVNVEGEAIKLNIDEQSSGGLGNIKLTAGKSISESRVMGNNEINVKAGENAEVYIESRGLDKKVVLEAGKDIRGGTIIGHGDIFASAVENIVHQKIINRKAGKNIELHALVGIIGGVVEGQGKVEIKANEDIVGMYASSTAGNEIDIESKNNINNVTVGGSADIVVKAVKDIVGGSIIGNGDIFVRAEENINNFNVRGYGLKTDITAGGYINGGWSDSNGDITVKASGISNYTLGAYSTESKAVVESYGKIDNLAVNVVGNILVKAEDDIINFYNNVHGWSKPVNVSVYGKKNIIGGSIVSLGDVIVKAGGNISANKIEGSGELSVNAGGEIDNININGKGAEKGVLLGAGGNINTGHVVYSKGNLTLNSGNGNVGTETSNLKIDITGSLSGAIAGNAHIYSAKDLSLGILSIGNLFLNLGGNLVSSLSGVDNINAGNVDINAASYIGTQNRKVGINASTGMNILAGGDVYIGSSDLANIKKIDAGSGNISVNAGRAIVNTASDLSAVNIKGNNLFLNAGNGGIAHSSKFLNIDISGILTAESKYNVYVNSEKDLFINSITAPGSVYLTSMGSIFNAGAEANINAAHADMRANNDIGQENKFLLLNISGKIMADAAQGSIYLKTLGDMVLSNVIHAGGGVNLESAGDIIGMNIRAKDVFLKAGGSILGCFYSTIYLINTGSLTAKAGENIFLCSYDIMTVNNVSAGGDVYLEAANGILSEGSGVNIKAVNATLQVNAVWKSSYIGNAGKPLTLDISGVLTSTAKTSDIYLHSLGDIALNKIFTSKIFNLESEGKITNAAMNGAINIIGWDIMLKAHGGIGSDDSALVITSVSSVDIHNYDSGNINIIGKGQNFNVGNSYYYPDGAIYFKNIINNNGDINIFSETGVIYGMAGSLMKGKHVTLNAFSILGADNYLRIDADLINASSKWALFLANPYGDLNIEKAVARGYASSPEGYGVWLSAAGGIFDKNTTGEATVQTKDLKLTSGAGIGEANKALTVDLTGTLIASAQNGSIFIDSVRDLALSNIITQKLYLNSLGNITNFLNTYNGINITAGTLFLNASGDIGQSSKELVVNINEDLNMESGGNKYVRSAGGVALNNIMLPHGTPLIAAGNTTNEYGYSSEAE